MMKAEKLNSESSKDKNKINRRNPPSLQDITKNINLGLIKNNDEAIIRAAFLQHKIIRDWSDNIKFKIFDITLNTAKCQLQKTLGVTTSLSEIETLPAFGVGCDTIFNISFTPLAVNINWLLSYFNEWFNKNTELTFNSLSFPDDNNKNLFVISNLNRIIHEELTIPEQIIIAYQNYHFTDFTIIVPENDENITSIATKIWFSNRDGSRNSLALKLNNIFTIINNANLGILANNLPKTIMTALIGKFPQYEQTIKTLFVSNYYRIEPINMINATRFLISYLTIDNQWIACKPLNMQLQLNSLALENMANLRTDLQQLVDINRATFIRRIHELNPELDLEYGIRLSFLPWPLSSVKDPISYYKAKTKLENNNQIFQVWLYANPINGSNYSGACRFTFTLPQNATVTPFTKLDTWDLSRLNLLTDLGVLDNNNYDTIKVTIEKLNPNFNIDNLSVLTTSNSFIILQARDFRNFLYNGIEQRYSGNCKFTFTLKNNQQQVKT